MPQIVTFTANLLAETTYSFGDWKSAQTQRAKDEFFQVGGKGINVSKMLTRVGAYNEAICFPGGDHGPRCLQWLNRKNIRTRPYPDGCEVRSGAVVRSERIAETTFLGKDSTVSPQAVTACVADLSEQTNHFVFAICGSIQDWEGSQWDAMRTFVQSRRVECHLVVDTYGPALPWFLQQKPELVKINRSELDILFGNEKLKLPTEELIDHASREYECHRWIITDGDREICYKYKKAPCKKVTPPQTVCVSATGCGDVFFATVINELFNGKSPDLHAAIEKSADFASRNAAKLSIAEFSLA